MMKKRLIISLMSVVTSLTLILSTNIFTISTQAYTGSNWMGAIADNRSLASLSIPGTHDSGARYEPLPGTAKCQDLTIAEQLNAGVRFLDIRCRHIDNAFAIHHGSVYQNLNFDDVLNACYSFLNSNPTETIIMSVKEEYNPSNVTRTFEETFDSYVAKNPSRWYLGTSVPNLGTVRGKIVLFRRFPANSPKGINMTNWADNTTFTVNTGYDTVKVQDQYVVPDNAEKWTKIQNMYNEARNYNPNWLYVNFTSGYKPLILGIPSITTVSNYVNPRLEDFFEANTHGRFGISVMDFANAYRCSLIIATNF